ncbi:hypothetical protein BN871_EN_00050 [Paenibacillus sp. P22]|nr:hypothetical protein BN871_EN_00050 [Paenibacillus sp. P22]
MNKSIFLISPLPSPAFSARLRFSPPPLPDGPRSRQARSGHNPLPRSRTHRRARRLRPRPAAAAGQTVGCSKRRRLLPAEALPPTETSSHPASARSSPPLTALRRTGPVVAESRVAGIVHRLAQGGRCCFLHSGKDAVIDVRLELLERSHGICAACHEADAAAGHMEAFGHRMEFDGDFLCAWKAQNAEGAIAPISHFRIGQIKDEQRPVPARLVHEPLQHVHPCRCPDRIARQADEHEARLVPDVFREEIGIGQKTTLRPQRQEGGLHSRYRKRSGVDRVAGIRHDRRVAGIADRRRQMRQPVLGTHQRHDLRLRIHLRPEPMAQPLRRRPPEFDAPLGRRIPVRLRPQRRFGESLAHRGARRQIRAADAEVDHV